MTKLFYTGSIHTSRQVKTLWAIGKVSNTPDEIGSPQDLLKKDIAKIDSLELTSVGKADMLIRLAR